MKERILKLNHFIFAWYYNRVGEHFHQWTFFKSVKLLISNYDHAMWWTKEQDDLINRIQKINDKDLKELRDIKMRQTATESQINWANKTFGTDFSKPSDN